MMTHRSPIQKSLNLSGKLPFIKLQSEGGNNHSLNPLEIVTLKQICETNKNKQKNQENVKLLHKNTSIDL